MPVGVDMKIGSYTMTGFTSPTLQRNFCSILYCVMSALFGLYQATRGYVRCLRWLARFDLATICLALAFVFSGTIGAVAQTDTTRPMGQFEFDQVKRNHDGVTPVKLAFVFNEPVFKDDGGVIDGCGIEISALPRRSERPDVDDFKQDPENPLRYTFSFTPVVGISTTQEYIPFINSNSCVDAAGNGNLTTSWVRIRYAPNVAPIANAGPNQTVASGEKVTLDGRGSTDDGSINKYVWIDAEPNTPAVDFPIGDRNGSIVTFTAPVVAPGAANASHKYGLLVTDEAGLQGDADIVVITFTPPSSNVRPIANAGTNQKVVSGATVTLEGSGTDNGGTIQDYYWVQSSTGTAPALSANNVAAPTLTAPVVNVGDPDVTFSYALRVRDNAGAVSDDDEVTITVSAVADTTAPGGEFTRNPTHDGMTPITITVDFDEPVTGFVASDITIPIPLPVGFPVGTYGPTITNFAIDPTDNTRYTFTLTPRAPINIPLVLDAGTYDDEAGNMGPRLFRTVEFMGSNWPPVVTVGNDRSVVSGTPVTLEGTGKDIDGTVASYAWARTGGTQGAMATLTNANMAMASFTANTLEAGAADETHEFTLTVTDDDGATSTETVTITVTAPFLTTVAEAGDDRSVASGAMVELVGSGSTVDRRRTANYNWARTGGTTGGTATLTKANEETASFTADTLVEGDSNVIHIFTLTVTDDLNVMSTDTVTVTVLAPAPSDTTPPRVEFRNLPSTHDGETAFTVEVKFTEPVVGFGLDKIFGSLAENTDGAKGVLRENFALDPNDLTLYTITLTPRDEISFRVVILPDVTDASGNPLGQVTSALIRYAAPIAPPIADAGGDQIVFSGQTVTLDGSGTSDADDLVTSYLWERTGGTSEFSVNIVKDPDNPTRASFVADTLTAGASDVTHIIRLTVTDAAGNTDTDSATITVKEPFATPVANAGPDQLEVVSGTPVQLDGSGSSVDRRRTATYSWARTDGTTGGMVTFSPSATVESPTFPADTLTESDSDVTHIFTLTVTDGEGGSATDMVTVIVKAPVPDTTGPIATTFAALGLTGNNHDGMTPINFEVVFDEPIGEDSNGVSTFTAEDINRAPWNVPADEDAATHTAAISKFMKDPTNPLRYTFTLTPGVDSSGSGSELAFTVSIPQDKITDVIGNKNLNIRGPHLTYSAPTTPTFPELVAHAGVDQPAQGLPPILSGATVTLDGSGSTDIGTSGGRTVTYAWTQVTGANGGTGSPVTLSDPAAEMPTFTAETLVPGATAVTYIFTLTVTDNQDSDPATAMVTITVTAPPFPDLVAHAGVDQPAQGRPPILSGTTVTLDGSGSTDIGTSGGRTVTYAWTQVTGADGGTGSPVTLSDPAAEMPTFTAETLVPGATAVTYIFTLTVTDNQDSDPATAMVTITVTAPPFPDLVAEAGPDQPAVPSGMQNVQLDSTGSTMIGASGGRTVTYAWTREQGSAGGTGSPVNLSDPAIAMPTFNAPTLTVGATAVTYIFTLTVTDNKGSTEATDKVTIRVLAPVAGQVANAGNDQSVASGATVTLDGSASMVGNGPISEYNWTRESGTSTRTTVFTVQGGGVAAQRATTESTTTFVADNVPVDGSAVTHVFALVVLDADDTPSPKDTVTITVNPNLRPTANAGPDTTYTLDNTNDTVSLDGSDSFDGTETDKTTDVNYFWVRSTGANRGTGGNVTLTGEDTATPTFTPTGVDSGAASVTYGFTLTVTDNESATHTDMVLITINAPPIALPGDPQTVPSGETIVLDGSGSLDGGARIVGGNGTYSWTRTGGTGDSTKTWTGENTAMLSVTPTDAVATQANAVTHIFTLTVTDSDGASHSDTVTLTVEEPIANPTAVIDGAAALEVRRGAGGTLVGNTGSVVDRRRSLATSPYGWARTGGSGNASSLTLGSPGMAQTTFTTAAGTPLPGKNDETHEITLTVTDDEGDTGTALVTVSVMAPPRANAGPDQLTIASGATVQLDGSGSEVGSGRTLDTYAWTREQGSAGGTGGTVILSDPAARQPTFTAPTLNSGDNSVNYIFTLTVTDNNEFASAADTVMITVVAPDALPNVAPVADAGDPQRLSTGGTGTLDGSGSRDPDGTRVTYSWARTGGTTGATAPLTGATSAMPGFTVDTPTAGGSDETHIFTLTVTDDDGATHEDTVTITVNAPPLANAGTPQTVASGAAVTLNGSGSDTTGDFTYAWTRSPAPDRGNAGNVALTRANTAMATFTAVTLDPGAADAIYGFTLTVTDDDGATAVSMVKITVTSGLIAHAGNPWTVDSGAPVTLDGSGSTDIGTSGSKIVSYAWTRTGGTGSVVVLTGANTATPSFTAETLAPGATAVTYIFTLTVTDNQDSTPATATVTITVTAPPFAALVARAGPDQDNVASGATVTLDGSGSTGSDSNRMVTYSWARTGGTAGGTVRLTDATTLAPSFTADTLNPGDADVEHIITLTVMDDQGSTEATDTVTITVTAPTAGANMPPVANAGPDQLDIVSGAPVRLDGSRSSDRDGTFTFAWERTGGTEGATAPTLSDKTAEWPTFTADILMEGDPDVIHIFTLTVVDNDGAMDTDTVTVAVNAVPNKAPVARITNSGSGPIPVAPGATVTLNGSGSMDDDGEVRSYLWRRTDGTGDPGDLVLSGERTAILSVSVKITADTAQASFVANTAESGAADLTHIFTLTVTDDNGASHTSAPVTVIVSSAAQMKVDILVSPPELTVQEGDSGSYQVKLSESPRQQVSVIAFSDNENVVLENSQLMFNASNWDAWQEVTISTVADSDNEDETAQIQHRLVNAQGVAMGQPGFVSVTVRDEDRVLRPIGKFLETRISTLLNNQPNLSSFLKPDGTTPGGSGNFTFRATNGRVALDGGFVRDGVWGQVTGSYASSDSGDVKSVLGSFGFHRKYSERFLAGAMLQFDLAEHDLARQAGMIDGTGWLVGPYFAARNGKRPLYFEGRLLYGQSDNDIRFNDLGTGTGVRNGSFDTKRLLAQLRVQGEIALSDENGGPRLIPYADARWVEDRAATFTTVSATGLRNSVPGQKVSAGQLELGSNVEVPIAMSHGAMTFTGGLGLVYSNTEGDFIPSVSRSHGRGEIGLSYGLDDNVQIDFESFYDGIGTSGYEGYGLSLRAEMKF